MPLTIDSYSSPYYDTRTRLTPGSAVQRDDTALTERLQASREEAQQRLEERRIAEQERQQQVREEQELRLRQEREEAARTFSDRVREQSVDTYLEDQRLDAASGDGPLSPDSLARQRLQLEANQLTFGLDQPSVTPRLAAEAIATYRATEQGPDASGRGLVA